MRNAGWNLDVLNWQANKAHVAAKCKRGQNWFGWSYMGDVGTVSTTLQGSGEIRLDFGNCWSSGVVKVYLNSREVANADRNTPSKIVSFSFKDGDLLEMKDTGDNSIIAINDISFICGKSMINLVKGCL